MLVKRDCHLTPRMWHANGRLIYVGLFSIKHRLGQGALRPPTPALLCIPLLNVKGTCCFPIRFAEEFHAQLTCPDSWGSFNRSGPQDSIVPQRALYYFVDNMRRIKSCLEAADLCVGNLITRDETITSCFSLPGAAASGS